MSSHPPDPPTKIKVLSGRIAHEPDPDLLVKKVRTKTRRPREAPESNPNPPPSAMSSASEVIDPLYVETSRDLEETIRDMQPCFEGKETEQNWSRREKSILKLRRITKGNSPQELTVAYLAGLKTLLDGILKTVNSLRTTVSSNGCHLVQEMAKASGSGLDGMVEILLQSLVKLCANTKKITAANGDATVSAVLANVTYNVRLAQHIWGACQDKNVQPRSYATGWLKTIITKHRHHKNVLEHAGSLDLLEKCIKAGLADRDPKVRESMRPTYWAFARLWPEKSEAILLALDDKQQKSLIHDPSNPNPHKDPEPSTTVTGMKVHPFSRSTNSVPPQPSIRETIAAQKRAKMAGKNLPERPGSAEPSATPMKLASSISRPATAMSTTGTLSSAPVRPMRPARRPEMKRPVIADPQSSRRPARVSPTKTAEDIHNSPSSGKKSSQSSTKSDGTPLKDVVSKTTGIPSRINHDTAALKEDFPPDNVPKEAVSPVKRSDPKIAPPEREPRNTTPRTSNKKENPTARLKVYEDPSGEGPEVAVASPSITRSTVLEELPVNEPAVHQPRVLSDHSLEEESETPFYSRKRINVDTAARRVSDADRTENPYFMRRILESGITRVRAGTLDVHGFRKLQALIRDGEDIWEGGVKFDELIQPLLENLESPNHDTNSDSKFSPSSARAQDQIKTQVLMTIRLLQQNQPKYFSAYYSQALCTIILARKHHQPTSHIVCGLEETSETIVAQCEPGPCIDAVLDLLETETSASGDGTLFMGLYVLAGLLHRLPSSTPPSSTSTPPSSTSSQSSPSKSHTVPLAQTPPTRHTRQSRLGQLVARCISDTNPDIRRAVIEFALELHDSVQEPDGFWKLVDGASEDQRSLITYYLARRERGYAGLGVEGKR